MEVIEVVRRDLSSFIETNGVLEAEREVDLVARAAGPITELAAEENQFVRQGQLLARLDQSQARATLELSQVEHAEAELSFERVQTLHEAKLISREQFEQSRARLDSAQARLSGDQIQLTYTEIRAPFDGLIVRRYVKFAESVASNQPLFRLSDFTPLLCVIQVPERSLSLLATGQPAYLTVEGYPAQRFSASVLRISPVVEAGSGTVRVTLELSAARELRPGMFASVFLETEQRAGVLVLPREALSLDSVGDSVFVVAGEVAQRRELQLGVRDGDLVEVLAGLSEGEQVVGVGQDGLADGTPIQILGAGAVDPSSSGSRGSSGSPSGSASGQPVDLAERGRSGSETSPRRELGGTPASTGDGSSAEPSAAVTEERSSLLSPLSATSVEPGGADPSQWTPEMLQRIKDRMRSRGMTDEQIEARLEQMRQGAGDGS